ncbi:MAG: exodeoxyribonuclease V subunit gamma, partial [Myxococcales bacterium]|nr:exodeoxyribonuclease V subunit gamma [Myxococcales bacterium]
FPRGDSRVGFHRMAEAGARCRRGDRSPRDDDRYMFLEALLSARDALLVTYVGSGIHDNRAMPPSVVVGELLDAVHQGFRASPDDDRAATEERLRTKHRMHAFSAAYYTPGSPLFSYAEHYCAGARSLGQHTPAPAFLSGAIDEPPELLELSIEQLCAWVGHPIRGFFRDRLGVTLGDELTPLRDREPMDLRQLDRGQLGRALLGLALDDVAFDHELVRARGALPLGTVGELDYAALRPQVQALAAAVEEVCGGDRLPPVPVDLTHEGVRITGALHELYPGAQVGVTFSRPGRRGELAQWVRHVILGALHERGGVLGYPTESAVISNGERAQDPPSVLTFAPLAEPFAVLSGILSVVRAAAVQAVPFAYASGRAYAERRFAVDADPDDAELERRALRDAAGAFGGDYGDGQDAYVAKVYPDLPALLAPATPDFRTISRLLLAPMIAHGRRA